MPKTNFFDFAKDNLIRKKILLDFKTFNYKFLEHLIKITSNKNNGIEHDSKDLIYSLWKDRPSVKTKSIFKLKKEFVGCTVAKKHQDLFKSLKSKFIINSLFLSGYVTYCPNFSSRLIQKIYNPTYYPLPIQYVQILSVLQKMMQKMDPYKVLLSQKKLIL